MAGRQATPGRDTSLISIETRYRYNPDVKSLPAIVPAVIRAVDDDPGDAQRAERGT